MQVVKRNLQGITIFKISLLILALTVFKVNLQSQQETADILNKGVNLHKEKPDSALFYYNLLIDDYLQKHSSLSGNESLNKDYLSNVIEASNAIGNIYYYRDEYARSEVYFKQSLEIARSVQMNQYIARALFDIAYVRYKNNNYADALKLFNQANTYYHELSDTTNLYQVANAIGLCFSHMRNFEKADSSFRLALHYAGELNDSSGIADVKIHLGILFAEQEMLDEGIRYFEEALDYFDKTADSDAISDALLNIGVVLAMAGDYEHAQDYMLRSLRYEEMQQIKSQLVIRYYHLADLYLKAGNMEKAYEFSNKTLIVANEIGSKPFAAESNFLMGKYYFGEKNYTEAASFLDIAEKAASELGNNALLARISLWQAKNSFRNNEITKAMNEALTAYQMAKELDLKARKRDAAYVLYQISKKKNSIKDALHWFELYHSISDTLNFASQQKEIRRIEAHYNFEKKEQENELLRNQNKLQEQKIDNRTITIIALSLTFLLSLAIIVLLVFRIKLVRAKNREQRHKSLKQLEELSSELDGKKRELASKMMFLNQKNDLINRIINQLKEIQDSSETSAGEINAIVSELRSEAPQSNWKEFETQFVQVHPDFYKRLFEQHPELTSYEQRICAFLRMNLNTKEISSITGRSTKSIEVTRSRIRKKLGLSRKDNLSSFLASV